jgi:hypothetical protein
MGNFTGEALEEVLRPIASLIGKSEKAREKLPSGTWQRAMLDDNLKALALSSRLIGGDAGAENIAREDLLEALGALNSMIERSEKAQTKLSPGTSQHTLLKNRIKALRVASERIEGALEARGDA